MRKMSYIQWWEVATSVNTSSYQLQDVIDPGKVEYACDVLLPVGKVKSP